MICHDIMNKMTALFIESMNTKEKRNRLFEFKILTEFQKGQDSFLHKLFEKVFPQLPNQGNDLVLCKMMVMIVLKNYFVDAGLRQAISEVKKMYNLIL